MGKSRRRRRELDAISSYYHPPKSSSTPSDFIDNHPAATAVLLLSVTLNPTREFRFPFSFSQFARLSFFSFRESMQETIMACYDVDVTHFRLFLLISVSVIIWGRGRVPLRFNVRLGTLFIQRERVESYFSIINNPHTVVHTHTSRGAGSPRE